MLHDDCYLLTEAMTEFNCSFDELIDALKEHEHTIGFKPDPEWYFWKIQYIDGEQKFLSPVQAAEFQELYIDEYDEILTKGFLKVSITHNGYYCSTNPKFKLGGVIVKKEHLAISKSHFDMIAKHTRPDELTKSPLIENKMPSHKQIYPIAQSERNTMLKLIIGMAMDAYGYNPDAPKNKATGENNGSIKAALDRLGIGVDADTVRKYLNEAKELL